MKNSAGFTIVELLVVIGIIGLMAGLLGYNVFSWMADSRLNEAATNVMADLRTARSKAQTTSADSVVTLCTTTGASCATSSTVTSPVYAVSLGGAPALTRTLPYGIVIASTSNTTMSGNYTNTITYSSPYAETTATGLIWRVTDRRGKSRFVKVTGVTGKVMLSATAN